jgi:hypothetical protein
MSVKLQKFIHIKYAKEVCADLCETYERVSAPFVPGGTFHNALLLWLVRMEERMSLLLLFIPILRITCFVSQNVAAKPPTHHDSHSVAQRSHQPVWPERECKAHLSAVEEKEQLWQRRADALDVAIVQVCVDIAKA